MSEKKRKKRMARLRELWIENENVVNEPAWTPFALSAANQIAKGVYKIHYDLDESYAEQRRIESSPLDG